MSLGDRFSALRLPLLGARRDATEEQRLLKLYWNRAELKKALSGLDDQLYQLRDRLKQQEAATERAVEQSESLEMLLGNPELGLGALVHFQLRALWKACHLQLEQFGAELRRQQEERERKRQLVEFHQDRKERARLATERLAEAGPALEQQQVALDAIDQQLLAARGFWHYFRRRALTEQRLEQAARVERARHYVDDMQEAKRTIEKEPWPELGGLGLEGRRAINLAVLAYAQLLYARLAESGLALQSRLARLKSVHESNYGSREECNTLMADIAVALALVRQQKDLVADIRARSELLRAAVSYREPGDAVPDPGSLPSAFAGSGGGVPVREHNVLADDYWDVYTVLLR
jgi:hypothetical protein